MLFLSHLTVNRCTPSIWSTYHNPPHLLWVPTETGQNLLLLDVMLALASSPRGSPLFQMVFYSSVAMFPGYTLPRLRPMPFLSHRKLDTWKLGRADERGLFERGKEERCRGRRQWESRVSRCYVWDKLILSLLLRSEQEGQARGRPSRKRREQQRNLHVFLDGGISFEIPHHILRTC